MVTDKVLRAVQLQNRVNDMIEHYGQADPETVEDLMTVIDSLTEEEETQLLQLANLR